MPPHFSFSYQKIVVQRTPHPLRQIFMKRLAAAAGLPLCTEVTSEKGNQQEPLRLSVKVYFTI